jgi:hypothetical protein
MVIKKPIFCLALCFAAGLAVRGQEAPPSPADLKQTAEIPKGYEVGEKSVSPNVRFGSCIRFGAATTPICRRTFSCVSSHTHS